jgi:hypothetical protein
MKTLDFFLLLFAIGGCAIVLSFQIDKTIKQSETRIIEAIKTQNDSINAVKFLNREKRN